MEAVNETSCEAPTRTGKHAAAPAERPFHETRAGWLMLALVWLASAIYLAVHLRQMWYPLDAGALAQMADRVLRGQVPYRNFVGEYTGGLTYLNALAFRLFGMNFFSPRIPLFIFFIAWVPSVYFIARRFAGPILAGMVVFLSVAWSVPVYPEAMPSWYNLFFATWGTLALFRYIETEKRRPDAFPDTAHVEPTLSGRPCCCVGTGRSVSSGSDRWLWIAGLCGGLSFLIKTTASYFIAAALLFFVFRELTLSQRAPGARPGRAVPYRLFTSAGLLLFLAVVVQLIANRPTLTEALYFILPSACIVALLLWETWRAPSDGVLLRFRRLFSMGLPFLSGFFLLIAPFLAWYFVAGALAGWFRENLVGASTRFLWAAASPPPTPWLALGLVPAAAIIGAASARRAWVRLLSKYGAPVLLAGLLFASRENLIVRWLVGYALPLAVPLIAIWALYRFTGRNRGTRLAGQEAVLVVAVATICSLVQFPLSGELYFCYVAPLVFLAALALLAPARGPGRAVLASIAAFYLVFAVWLRPPAYFQSMNSIPGRPIAVRTLRLKRAGGLVVKASEATEFERLIPLVLAHADGAYIYCTPDCPEVYFLSGKRNPTPAIDEFLDPGFLDTPARTGRILYLLDSHAVHLVVLRSGANDEYSGPVPPLLRTALDSRFPNSKRVGRMLVRWR